MFFIGQELRPLSQVLDVVSAFTASAVQAQHKRVALFGLARPIDRLQLSVGHLAKGPLFVQVHPRVAHLLSPLS
jgi:hypothetical protein